MFRPRRGTCFAIAAFVAAALCGVADGAEHPFILWTKKDAAALRGKIETQAVAEADGALAVAVVGRPGTAINDRLLLRFGDKALETVTLSVGNLETYTFANYAYLRIARDTVCVRGDLKAMKLALRRRPKLLLINGKPHKFDFSASHLSCDARKP